MTSTIVVFGHASTARRLCDPHLRRALKADEVSRRRIAAAGRPLHRAATRMTILAALSIPATTLAQVAERPVAQDFVPGEQWTWQRTDDLTHLPLGTSWRRSLDPHDGLLFVGSSGRNFGIDQAYQAGTWRQWPLAIGKTWTHRSDWTSANGSGETTGDATVVAQEDITVPAGTFKTFRIEYRGIWTMTTYAKNRVSGTVKDVYWYAPDVKADVRQTHLSRSVYGIGDYWTSELTSYVRPAKD